MKGYPQPMFRRGCEGLAFWRVKEALNQRYVSMHQPVEKFPQTRRATRWVAKPSANSITETGGVYLKDCARHQPYYAAKAVWRVSHRFDMPPMFRRVEGVWGYRKEGRICALCASFDLGGFPI